MKARDNRTRRITIRFTEKEYIAFRTQMANDGYLSQARYIRDRVLYKRIVVRKTVKMTDRTLRNQINNMTAVIAKIGVDYNQATKKFNSLAKMTRADGSPVINARAANYYISQLYNLTKKLNAAVNNIVEVVSKLKYREFAPDDEEDTSMECD